MTVYLDVTQESGHAFIARAIEGEIVISICCDFSTWPTANLASGARSAYRRR